ncbi:hypothetical protein BDN72DRAFT_128982 [Pluteus cervinus]|uniref:Uncharacterized protein n=1 Tax=Pluteus cervinus TaxID=181527 RepID=A0ACD3AMI9_9AGAR|nr:hypothetical protein BDN72DRAFT_128982 [Pluteus cervinus]
MCLHSHAESSSFEFPSDRTLFLPHAPNSISCYPHGPFHLHLFPLCLFLLIIITSDHFLIDYSTLTCQMDRLYLLVSLGLAISFMPDPSSLSIFTLY